MKVLIVAHPDDEILWFAAEEFDRIVICFGGRPDKPEQGERRRLAISKHPLRDRITFLDMLESGFTPNGDAVSQARHAENYTRLCAFLADLQADEVTTHNALGEYRHWDHILIHNACMATLKCRVNGKDPELYRQIKAAYVETGCWTWY